MASTKTIKTKSSFLIISLALSLGLAAVLSGCAPTLVTPTVDVEQARAEAERQRELAFTVRVERYERLLNVGLPLMVTASELCRPKVHTIYGFLLHDTRVYGKKYEEVAARHFGIGSGVYVRYVHPATSAERAGLRVNDRVLTVYGKQVGELRARYVMDRIEEVDGPTITLEVERGGRTLEFAIDGITACNYGIVMVGDDSVNAFADGNNIAVTTGMLRFVEDDTELSLVMAHEMSHNALGHLEKRYGNILRGCSALWKTTRSCRSLWPTRCPTTPSGTSKKGTATYFSAHCWTCS
jgi:hypothetical protein